MEIMISTIENLSNMRVKEAINASNTNVKDDKIDNIEMIKLKSCMDDLWKTHDCTREEYKAIFGFLPDENYVSTDTKISDINEKLLENERALNNVEFTLRQEKIDLNWYNEYTNNNAYKTKMTAAGISIASLIAGGIGSLAELGSDSIYSPSKFQLLIAKTRGVFYGLGVAALLAAAGIHYFTGRKDSNNSTQVQLREFYQNEFNRLMEERVKLTTEKESLTAK